MKHKLVRVLPLLLFLGLAACGGGGGGGGGGSEAETACVLGTGVLGTCTL